MTSRNQVVPENGHGQGEIGEDVKNGELQAQEGVPAQGAAPREAVARPGELITVKSAMSRDINKPAVNGTDAHAVSAAVAKERATSH